MVTLYITADVFVVMLREVSQDRKKAQPAENVCLKEDTYCLPQKILMAALLLIIINYMVVIVVVQVFTCFRLRWRWCHFPEEPARWKL